MVATLPATDFQEKALRCLNDLPPFSPVLTMLIASLAREDVQFSQIAATVEKDTVLAGNVLRLVNSAMYGRRGTINSVSRAITILGLDKLRNAALSFSINAMWKKGRTAPGWSSARFNLHSIATALIADAVVQHVPVEYAEGAFVSGLFHDIGKLMIATSLHTEYSEIQKRIRAGDDAIGAEKAVIGITHPELSAAALDRWNLPEQVHSAVCYHHRPEEAPANGSLLHLALVIRAASRTAHDLGITIAAPPVKGPEQAESFPALESLGLGDQAQSLVLAHFQAEFESIGSLY